MPNDNKNADPDSGVAKEESDPNSRADIERKTGQESQDALRHKQDAAHHKKAQ